MVTDPAPAASTRRDGRDALIAWVVAAVLVTVLVQINVTLPAVGDLGSALVAVVFLYLPMYVAFKRKEDIHDYGFHVAPVIRGLATAGIAIAVIFPLFALCYFAFYELACHSSLLAHLVPRDHQTVESVCKHYGGLSSLHLPAVTLAIDAPDHVRAVSLEWCAVQLIVVALPEELFFRGLLLSLLEKRFPPKRRILGGGVGWALVLSSIGFALIHLPKDGDPRALATFFPALLFGWMRSASGSILASTVTHASSNILIKLLDLMVLR